MKLRPVVRWFAEQMEAALRRNDHKGGWDNDKTEELVERAWEELNELEVADIKADAAYAPRYSQATRARRCAKVIAEAADVANMAMMVADHYRDGGPSANSGRDEPTRTAAGGPARCGWHPRDIRDDERDDLAPVSERVGPDCGKPATHISCMPFVDTPTCEEHKCRCAKPIAAGGTEGDDE